MGGAGQEPYDAYRVLEGMPGRKRTLERPRCRCENIKIDVKRNGLEGRGMINLSQDRYQ
jgi:hypothetical protein